MTKWQKLFQLFVALVLLAGLLGSMAQPGRIAQPKAHPLLVGLAAGSPEQMISVIVQKAGASNRAEELAKALGGRVTKHLGIINAFAAEMRAGAALELAANPAVRWVSPDAPVENSARKSPPESTEPPPSATGGSTSLSTYFDTVGASQVWAIKTKGALITGRGIGVAVIDSGTSQDADFRDVNSGGSRLLIQQAVNPGASSADDYFGHGTHVAGIIGGNGSDSGGAYRGIAPGVNLIGLKICDDRGNARESDVVAAMQWVYDNKSKYNIRVVNLSLNSTIEQSYHTSPLDAAAEILWFNGVVVVVSAGNYGSGGVFNTVRAAPANDPFVITVGAASENGTTDPADDYLAIFSAFGRTTDGFAKPDILAPGWNIISVLSSNSNWDETYPERVVLGGQYFRLSGTSMSAPIVSGAVALLLQKEPNLTPDQVKYRLLNTGRPIHGYTFDAKGFLQPAEYPYLDIYAALTKTTSESSNLGTAASQLLWTGSEPVAWDGVAWNAVAWNAVAWNAVAWNAVAWNSVYWGP